MRYKIDPWYRHSKCKTLEAEDFHEAMKLTFTDDDWFTWSIIDTQKNQRWMFIKDTYIQNSSLTYIIK